RGSSAIPLRLYARGRDELLTLVFGQGRTAGSPQPCDGLVLFGRKRGRFSKPVGQATVTPGVIVQQTSETPRQCIRGIEHRNIGALQFGESRRVAPASRPQESDALASALAETDDLLRLGVRPGARNDQRADLGLIE